MRTLAVPTTGLHVKLADGEDATLTMPTAPLVDIEGVGAYESIVTVDGGRDVRVVGGDISPPKVRAATLTKTIGATDTVLPVDSTDGFPANGMLRLDGESIRYTAKTATSFTRCTRNKGFFNTSAVSSNTTHQAGAKVYISERQRSGISFTNQTGDITVEDLTCDGYLCDAVRVSGGKSRLFLTRFRLGPVTNYDLTYQTDGHPDAIQAYAGGAREIHLSYGTILVGPNGNGLLNKGTDSPPGTPVGLWNLDHVEIVDPTGQARSLIANTDQATTWQVTNSRFRHPPSSKPGIARDAALIAKFTDMAYDPATPDYVPAGGTVSIPSPLPCPTCGRTPQQGCWTVSGHAPLKTPHSRQVDQTHGWDAGSTAGAASRDAEVKGLTDSLQLTGVQYKAAQQTMTDLRAQITELTEELADRPPVVVVEPKHPIPADAVTVTPGNPLTPGKTNVLVGTWPGFSQAFPNGSETTIIVPEDKTAVLDGKGGVKSAITAGGKVNLYGDLRIANYAPASTENGSNAAVYYGGTAAGSEIDGPSILASKMAGLGFQVPLKLTALTVTDAGYSGILGTRAKGSVLEQITITGANRGGHAQDGQLAGMKLTSSPGVTIRKFTASDLPGVHALWFDDGCQGFTVEDPDIDGTPVAGRAPMGNGIFAEITQGGTVHRGRAKGAGPGCGGLMVLDSGGITVDGTDLRGNFVSAWLQQDNRYNRGDSNAVIGSPTENPARTRDITLLNLTFDGPNQLWAYDDGLRETAGVDMFKRAAGLWFGPKVGDGITIRTGRKGSTQTDSLTLAAFAAALGQRAASLYQGPDPAAAAAARVAA